MPMTPSELNQLLADLDAAQLRALLSRLIARDPALADYLRLELLTIQLASLPATTASRAPEPSPVVVDATSIRRQVRASLREAGRSGYGDRWGGGGGAPAEVFALLEQASTLLRAGQGA